ncbi:magnesium chelatase subunit H [Roseisolibacter sp. H3M3-2]|nr:magnesium chelatase subunit H [Roseisolibacter sp. H3M3-2]MDF1501853.1 magnesium chelatase subunit H [Roseisolibacter sp. H3M3-2]
MPIRFVVVTLDAHLAGAFEAARARLRRELPGLELSLHVQADWDADPAALARCRAAIGEAHFIACAQLFTEEQAAPILDAVRARRDAADAVFCALCAPELTRLTKLGGFVMGDDADRSPLSPIALLRKLRGARGDGRSSGERQMAMLRRLPQLLRFVPGTAQDLRAYFLGMQYWLGGTAENLAGLVLHHVDRYAAGERAALRGGLRVAPPEHYPEVGVWHPALPGRGIADDASALPAPRGAVGTVGVLVGRSYLLAGNTRHYAAVVEALEARGLRALPVFASALDARPALERNFGLVRDGDAWRLARPTIDALVNLTGFSLVGGPAYNDAPAAQAALAALDVPYLSLQTLEFQSVAEWRADPRGLNPLQATLQVAIPELDGAIAPAVYGGRGMGTPEAPAAPSEPLPDRVAAIADRVARLVRLRRTDRARRKLAVVLFNFPPNAGNTGSAAYLAVFASLQRVLASLKEQGYTVDLPAGVDELRALVCDGNRERFGTPANVHARVPAEEIVRRDPHLADVERVWGPAPGRQLSDGGGVFVMGARLGNVFVGVQPSFGWEGDPMRLLFEGGFAPTHAFSTFYRWLREDFGADAVLHFGTHGALEFMPGKQAGLTSECWPERLIGDLPNVYLYASNNSSEGTLAKRRGAATLVSYLTPPVSNAGLYRGLAELKASLDRWRSVDAGDRDALLAMVQAQGAAVELCDAEPVWIAAESEPRVLALRDALLELEHALIPVGLHVVGEAMPPADRADTLLAMARAGLPGIDAPPLDGDDARAAVATLVETRSADAALRVLARAADARAAAPLFDELARLDALLRTDHEVPGILRALDARWVPPAPGGDLLRAPAVLPTGRNVYGFDPYRVPSAFALLEGRARADQLLRRHQADGHPFPETIAIVLWGTDNMKSEGTPLAQVLALMGAVPRFDAVGRLAGARLVPLAQLGRPRVDVVVTLSGIFRDLLPLQVKLLAEAALLCADADEPESENFVRRHALATVRETGCDLATAALRVFSNAEGAYGSNVNLLVETGQWNSADDLADQFVRRKSFAYGVGTAPVAAPDLLRRSLGAADLSFQNLDSVELGATDIDQYVESLGGMNRVIAQARGAEAPVYLGDHTGAAGKVRTLTEQVALESRTRLLNPKWYEAQLAHGYEGARNLAGHVTTTFGWSATGAAGSVPAWVYAEVGSTFVLDAEMRDRLSRLNPSAASAIAGRLLEANDRGYWTPDPATLDALRDAAADLEDRLEGVAA